MALRACGIAPNITAFVLRESVALVSEHGGVPPCPITTKLSRDVHVVVTHARYGHPLRFYITPHCPQCPPVAALKLRLVPVTAARPVGLRQQALCKVAFAGVGRTAVGASRSLARPTRRRLRVLVVVVAPGHWSGAARCVAGQWPAASHVVCAPAHPCASPLRGLSPARWSSRPPTVGAPSARAPAWLVFATGFVAGYARNTGATGRNGL